MQQRTDKVKVRYKKFTERIRDLIKDDQHFIDQDGERQIQDWNEFTETDDVEFREESQSATLDKTIPKINESFTPDVFGDTYLNKEIALMRGAGNSSDTRYGKVTKRVR